MKGCELKWWKATWCNAWAGKEVWVCLICSRAKSTSVGTPLKEGQVDVLCPEGLMRSGDKMYIQSEKVDGCKHHANRDDLTWGQEESEKAGKKQRVLGLESRQERRKDWQKPFSTWNSREKGRKYYRHPSVSAACSCIPSAGFTLCSSQHGGSFVLIIGWKLQKLYPQSQCLPPTNAAGSGTLGHGSPKRASANQKPSLFAFLQSGILKIPHGWPSNAH